MAIQLEFAGKKVFVADGATGVGRRISAAFHELGATVAINGPSRPEVERAIGDLGGGARLVAAPGDLGKTSELGDVVGRAIRMLEGLDVLVCAPAPASICPLDRLSEEYWQRVFTRGPQVAFFVAQACVSALSLTRGVIVNVASIIGLLGGPPGSAAYASANGAMVQMSRMMALELADHGVRVNTVCSAWSEGDSPQASSILQEYIQTRSLLRRAASLDECAAAVLYLAASASGYITGALLVADGGITSGHYAA
jgi:NAD(P)-dependent dehydrogenase (short-subunit alcohol dehydrogenase family)